MKESWVTMFLPNDEYKERRILYFIAEAFVLFIGFLGVVVLLNRFSGIFNTESSYILLSVIAILSLYYGFVILSQVWSMQTLLRNLNIKWN